MRKIDIYFLYFFESNLQQDRIHKNRDEKELDKENTLKE